MRAPTDSLTVLPHLLLLQASFDAISNRLIVGPVVETLVYSKVPGAVSQCIG